MGLGLGQAKMLVKKMYGGRIWVDSELGQGSKFYIILPLGEAGPSQAGVPQ